MTLSGDSSTLQLDPSLLPLGSPQTFPLVQRQIVEQEFSEHKLRIGNACVFCCPADTVIRTLFVDVVAAVVAHDEATKTRLLDRIRGLVFTPSHLKELCVMDLLARLPSSTSWKDSLSASIAAYYSTFLPEQYLSRLNLEEVFVISRKEIRDAYSLLPQLDLDEHLNVTIDWFSSSVPSLYGCDGLIPTRSDVVNRDDDADKKPRRAEIMRSLESARASCINSWDGAVVCLERIDQSFVDRNPLYKDLVDGVVPRGLFEGRRNPKTPEEYIGGLIHAVLTTFSRLKCLKAAYGDGLLCRCQAGLIQIDNKGLTIRDFLRRTMMSKAGPFAFFLEAAVRRAFADETKQNNCSNGHSRMVRLCQILQVVAAALGETKMRMPGYDTVKYSSKDLIQRSSTSSTKRMKQSSFDQMRRVSTNLDV